MPYTVNSRALTGEKPCINKAFLVLLMHRKLTFNMIVPGPLKLFRHALFNCHNTINWWCIRLIRIESLKKKKKKDAQAGVRVRYSSHHAGEPLVLQCGTIASNTYHYYTSIDQLRHHSLYIRHFLLCYSMNYRDFSVKSKLIISLFQTVKLSL